jgi:hypothetical protein
MGLGIKILTPLTFLIWGTLAGCGDNLLKSQEKKEPAEDAVLELENDNPDKAISILETALQDDPGNPKLLSILSYAFAARAGVEPLKLISKMTSSGTSTESGARSDSELLLLFGVVPEASTENLADIDRAVSILVSDIAADDRLPGDTLKLALFQTASLVMHMKAIDLDGDGEIEVEELASFSTASAGVLLSQLAAAQALMAADSDDATSQQAAKSLAKYQAEIDAMPGATSEEKLKNYLAGSTPESN